MAPNMRTSNSRLRPQISDDAAVSASTIVISAAVFVIFLATTITCACCRRKKTTTKEANGDAEWKSTIEGKLPPPEQRLTDSRILKADSVAMRTIVETVAQAPSVQSPSTAAVTAAPPTVIASPTMEAAKEKLKELPPLKRGPPPPDAVAYNDPAYRTLRDVDDPFSSPPSVAPDDKGKTNDKEMATSGKETTGKGKQPSSTKAQPKTTSELKSVSSAKTISSAAKPSPSVQPKQTPKEAPKQAPKEAPKQVPKQVQPASNKTGNSVTMQT